MDPFATFTLILIAVILLLVAEIEHRAIIAILAAVLSTYFGTSYGLFTPRDVAEMLNVETVLFITAVLILLESVSRSGLFDFLGLYLARVIGPRPALLAYTLLALVTIFSGISSNITVMMIMGNMTLKLAELMRLRTKRLVVLECIQTNVGGILLPLSSVPALIISLKTGIGFTDFIRVTSPLIALLTVLTIIYSRIIGVEEGGKASVKGLAENPWSSVKSRTALYRSAAIFTMFLISASLSGTMGLDLTFISFAFVAITFLLSSLNPDEIFRSVDWSIPFFVGGFFVFVGGLERSGVLDAIGRAIAPLLKMQMFLAAPLLLLMCSLISALIDNIPVVLLLYPIVEEVALEAGLRPLPLYWALIIGGNLGGNFTTFASPSVLIGVRMLERNGVPVSMGDYIKIGVPLTLMQIGIAMLYLSALTLVGYL